MSLQYFTTYILFILYTADLVSLVEQHGFHPHLYADDTQVYGSCCADHLLSPTSSCVCLRVSMTSPLGCWPFGCWPSAVKYRQDWPALVRDFLSSSSAAHFSSQDRVRPRQAVGLSQRSRNLLWRQPQHVMPHSENSCQLLRHYTPTAQYLTVSSNVSIPHARRRSRLVTARLRQCCAGGLTGLPVQPFAVSAQRCNPSPVYDAPTTSPTHSPVSTGWRSRSVFSLSWRQLSILATWLQICAVCLICRPPDDVWDRHSLTSSMSVSRSV